MYICFTTIYYCYYPIISLVYHSITGLIQIIYLPNQTLFIHLHFYHDQLLIIKKSQKKSLIPFNSWAGSHEQPVNVVYVVCVSHIHTVCTHYHHAASHCVVVVHVIVCSLHELCIYTFVRLATCSATLCERVMTIISITLILESNLLKSVIEIEFSCLKWRKK